MFIADQRLLKLFITWNQIFLAKNSLALKSSYRSLLYNYLIIENQVSKAAPMSTQIPNSVTNFKKSQRISEQPRDLLPESPNLSECRICLSRQEETTNPFISPCCCSGSIRYVHQNCIKQWIERVIQKNGTADCQLCKQNYIFQIVVQKQCFSCSEIANNVKASRTQFGIITFCLISSIALLIYAVMQLTQIVREDFFAADIASKIVTIGSIFISIGLITYLAPKYPKFFIKYKAEIKFQNERQ